MSSSIGQKFTPVTLLKFALPSIIMMILMSGYTIVDGIFISRYAGNVALSASNIVFPVVNLLLAVGLMFATGGSAIVGKKLGEGKNQEANQVLTMLVGIGISFSILLFVLVIFFWKPIIFFLGSSKILMEYCKSYLLIMLLFAPACMLQTLYQSFFVTSGNPRLGLSLTVIAGLSNIALDYLFVAVWGLGIEGAAFATGIGQLIPACIGTIYFIRNKKGLHFTKFQFHFAILKETCLNGSSEMVSNLSNAVITLLFNIILMRLIGESGVAAVTILLYAQFLFNSIYLGFSIGVAPVFSFHYGAENEAELKKLYKICMLFTGICAVVIACISFFTADHTIGIFITERNETYALALEGMRLFALSFLFSGFNIFSSGLFTALSDGKNSAIISFSRTFVITFLSLLILPEFLGITGVWLAIPMAELCSAFLSAFLLKKNRDVYCY